MSKPHKPRARTTTLEPLSPRERGRGEGTAEAKHRAPPEPSSGAARHLLPEGEGKAPSSSFPRKRESSDFARLSDRDSFQTLNGLWKGKSGPLTRATVIRNTNFTNDGHLDLSNVAMLDVETRQLATRTLQRHDIIIERSGGGPKQPVGRVCIFDAEGELPFSFSNFTSVIRVVDREKWLPRYVHYYLLHLYKDGYTESLQHATTGIRNLDFSSYLDTTVPSVSKPEQEKIAAALWKLQRAIATQDKLLAATADLKASAMQRLFTHGLRGEPLKDTEIGPMPAGWEVVTIGGIAKISAGGTPSRGNPGFWSGGTIPWVKTGEVDYGVILDTEEKITPSGLKNSAAKLLPKGTLLVAMYGQGVTRGKAAILGIEAATNQACAAIRPDEGTVRTDFLFHVLAHGYERLRALAHGGQQQNLNADLIRGFAFGRPTDTDEQRAIASALATLDRKLAHHHAKRAALHDLFQTLLHQLMTGAVRVDALEIDVSEVADHFVDADKMVDGRGKPASPDHILLMSAK